MEKGLIIAITGQSGSGKSQLGSIYSNMGYTVIDCDKVAADVLMFPPCVEKLMDYFGNNIVEDGKINKPLLAQLSFSSAQNLQALTDITHPYIIENILNIAQAAFSKGEKLVFVDGAVIVGYSFEKYCDKFIVVISSKASQYKRLSSRDSITAETAENRISKQTSNSRLIKKADYLVYNNSGFENLEAQAKNILENIIEI